MRESIFYRLLDRPQRGRSGGGTDPARILDDLREDVENLLNTRNSFRAELAESFPEAARSILAYGLPDSDDPWFSDRHSLNELCQRVRETVAEFEPRISNVRVDVVESPTARNTQRVVLEISATIVVGSHRERVIWNSVLQGGRIEIVAD